MRVLDGGVVPAPHWKAAVTQEMLLVAPGASVVSPGGHVMQSDDALRPSAAEYVPCWQSRQPVCPVRSCHVPKGHCVHVAAPAAEKEPVGHGKQFACCVATSRHDAVPAGHARHEMAVPPLVVENVPALHGLHAVAIVCPWSSLYEPRAQSTHALEPAADWYDPGAHERHAAKLDCAESGL